MVNWVHLEHTCIPDALALALRGKSLAEIGRETGFPSSSLSQENMGDALLVLEALTLALRGENVRDIARKNRDSNVISLFDSQARTLRTPKEAETRVKIARANP